MPDMLTDEFGVAYPTRYGFPIDTTGEVFDLGEYVAQENVSRDSQIRIVRDKLGNALGFNPLGRAVVHFHHPEDTLAFYLDKDWYWAVVPVEDARGVV